MDLLKKKKFVYNIQICKQINRNVEVQPFKIRAISFYLQN